ncbi:MAG: cysteine-rich CWC family protein [Pyrinomonadaceae bacterium]
MDHSFFNMNLPVIQAASTNESLCAPSVCAACGESFTCGATLNGCWCAEIKLSDETRAELRRNYQGCLCRTCLEKQGKGTMEGMRAEG